MRTLRIVATMKCGLGANENEKCSQKNLEIF
jgi:hypothetical protein